MREDESFQQGLHLGTEEKPIKCYFLPVLFLLSLHVKKLTAWSTHDFSWKLVSTSLQIGLQIPNNWIQ